MAGFKDFYQSANETRVIAGRDLLESTGFEFAKEGAHRVFVVTDQVIRETGLVDRVIAGVEDGGLEVAGVFDDVPQDSSTDVVDRCAEAGKAAGADSFLAVGGGSVMDTAKIADAVFTHGGSAAESEGFFLMPRADDGAGKPLPIAPLACIPTTCGTGSEVSMGAVVKDHERKVKLEIADFPLFPRLAILDPDTTKTLPPNIAAATGMDAMTHAIEGYVTLDWNPHQDGRSIVALKLIRENLERAVSDPSDEEARGNMLIAASLAITISLGSTHADVAPLRRALQRAPRGGERDQPAAHHPLQRRGRRGHRRPLSRPGRDLRRGDRRQRRRGGRRARLARRGDGRADGAADAAVAGRACPRTASPRWWRVRWATGSA